MFLFIALIVAVHAQNGYYQIESYDKFPAFVNAKEFHARGDKAEMELRRAISSAVYDALIAQNGKPTINIYPPGCDFLEEGPTCRINQGIVVGFGSGYVNPNDAPITYHTLRKIYGELSERNLTFTLGVPVPGSGELNYKSFGDIDIYGPPPKALRLKRL